MLLHFHSIKFIKSELRNALNHDGEVTAEERLSGFKVDLVVHLGRGEDVVSYRDVLHEDTLQFGGMGAKDLILLEGLQRVSTEVGNESCSLAVGCHLFGLFVLFFAGGGFRHGGHAFGLG